MTGACHDPGGSFDTLPQQIISGNGFLNFLAVIDLITALMPERTGVNSVALQEIQQLGPGGGSDQLRRTGLSANLEC